MAESIKYYSTNLNAPEVSFYEALLKGIAPDGGLYMPDQFPGVTSAELYEFSALNYYEIAYEIVRKFLVGQIPDEALYTLAMDAYNFEVPLDHVYDQKYVMRLDRGPTASFKDFAARMMGRLMQYFLQKENRNLLILTATSGDTGSAIANAFYGLDNIKVVILFPESEVTDRQRKQMTTLKKNISIIALDGKFDDCQAMVKKAFADKELDTFNLSSANSINIGRLLPQSVYYFWAYSQLILNEGEEIVFSVPSGNFGDLMGGLIAHQMGLPVKKFVVSTNENDEVPNYFVSGKYKTIIPSKNCISSAMNVGHPSNMSRIVALYGGVMNEKGNILKDPDLNKIKEDLYAISISDDDTRSNIKDAWTKHKLLLEPHGSVGWLGLMNFLKDNPEVDTTTQVCVSLETAHPAKFPKEIKEILKFDPELPESMKGLDDLEESFIRLPNDYKAFIAYLHNNHK